MWTIRTFCSGPLSCPSRYLGHQTSHSNFNQLLVPKRLFRKKVQDARQPLHIRRDANAPASPVLVENGASAQNAGAQAPNMWRIVTRQVLFTVGVCGASYAGAAVWQYENMRAEAMKHKWRQVWGQSWDQFRGQHDKALEWRGQMNAWWNSLHPGQRVFAPILAVNFAVWMAWRMPHMSKFMLRTFACNPFGPSPCLGMVTSAFSHHSFIHLAMNMYVLHSFCKPAVQAMGQEQFLGVYVASAAVSSLMSSIYKVALGSAAYSLGASGAIMAMIGVFGTLNPDALLQIVFVPGFTFTAATGLKAICALDGLGVIMRWRFFDHAGHLGGMLFGISWVNWGNEIFWSRRESVMRWWHENVRGEKKIR